MKGLQRSMKHAGQLLHSDPAYIFVSKAGNDSYGDGTITSPYLTITKALASVTTARKTIIVLPGEYAEAAAMVWPVIDDIKLIGIGGVTISAAGTTQIIGIAPGAVPTSSFDVTMEGIFFDHGNAGQEAIKIDNTNMTVKIVVDLKDVGGENDGGTGGSFILTVHGGTADAIRIYWQGDGGDGVEGVVTLAGGNDGDRFYAQDVDFNGGIATSVTDVVYDIILRKCLILHEGITGGHATQTVKLIDCFSSNGSGTFAAADASEVGTQTETIVGA